MRNNGIAEQAAGKSDNYVMPDFISMDLNGNEVTEEFFAGSKITLVYVWNTL